MSTTPTKILITGASGFIGQHLLEDLNSSNYSLRIITRNKSKAIKNISKNCEIVEADLTNFQSLLLATQNIDIIINIAAEVRNSEQLEATNITGTKNLVKAATENKVKKIIHLSSVGVVGMQYNSTKISIDETSDCLPKNGYEKTKLESEKILLDACSKHKINLVILRPTNVFGENHPFNALLNLIEHINKNKITICSKSAMVNYLYVKDLTKLMTELINNEKHGVFNVGESIQLSEFLQTIAQKLNKSSKIIYLPNFIFSFLNSIGLNKLKPVSNGVIYSDNKLKEFYKYPFDIKIGLDRTIDNYKKENLIK